MKNRVKILLIAVIGILVIGGLVNAATQISTAELKSGSFSVKGNNINGGSATLGGGLVEEGGKVEISAYKVVELWPDDRIGVFYTSYVDSGAYLDLGDINYKNLYYVKILQSSGSPHAKAKLTTEY